MIAVQGTGAICIMILKKKKKGGAMKAGAASTVLSLYVNEGVSG